jgi:DNA-binding protein YbaB
VDYHVNYDFQRQMDDMAADFQERRSRARELRKQLSAVTGSARSRDGMISVEVGAQGQLRGVWFDPGLFDRQSPQRLAAAIMELAGIATAEAARKVQEVMAPVLPAGGLPADGDLMSLMPQAPTTHGGGPPW